MKGELNLGENIADNFGLAIAQGLPHLAEGKKAPDIDGYIGEQRLYMGWTQGWQAKMHQQQTIAQTKAGLYSPDAVRAAPTARCATNWDL